MCTLPYTFEMKGWMMGTVTIDATQWAELMAWLSGLQFLVQAAMIGVCVLAGLTVWRLRNVLDPGVRWGYHQYT